HQRARHVLLDEARAGDHGQAGLRLDREHLLGRRPDRRARLRRLCRFQARRDRPTKSAALDYADRGVRVNAVCPGLVNTPPIADMITENPEMHEQLVASHPLGRIAEPEEVADSIVWLATSKSSYVTGVALPVDGGYLAR